MIEELTFFAWLKNILFKNGCFCYPNTFLFFEKQSTIEHMTWQLLGGQDLESWQNKFSFYKHVIDKSFTTSATTTTTTTATPAATPATEATFVQFSNLHSLSNSFFGWNISFSKSAISWPLNYFTGWLAGWIPVTCTVKGCQ